jgi:ABC-type transporter Mla MlaB component
MCVVEREFVIDLGHVVRPDLGHVDALCRFRLAARRFGWTLRVENAGADLRELFELVGLPLEVVGQPEGGEQLGIQEVVEPGDPLA